MNKLILLAAAAHLALATSVSAYGYCSEPSSEPWCLSDDDSFKNGGDFDSCRWEVERFVADVNEYVECLAGEQEEQIERADDVIRRFNCGAESGEACW